MKLLQEKIKLYFSHINGIEHRHFKSYHRFDNQFPITCDYLETLANFRYIVMRNITGDVAMANQLNFRRRSIGNRCAGQSAKNSQILQ